MTTNYLKHVLKAAACAAGVLLAGAGITAAQTVNLTAAPTSLRLPDGSTAPMWGYACNGASSGATCAAANPNAVGGWSPVVITAPTGSSLTVNLTNNLTFGANKIPTSLMIVGQVGGGLGDVTASCNPKVPAADGSTCAPSPNHPNQGTTWPIANTGPVFTPPAQGPRVLSFATEVPAGSMKTLTWSNLSPGTYLLESGTHPSIQVPMGLYGVLVVTGGPGSGSGTGAYPNVHYDAEVPVILGEIDPRQNNAVTKAVNTTGFSESATIGVVTGGPVASLNLTSGGSGYTAATVTFSTGAPTATGHAVVDTDSSSPTYGQVTEVDIDSGGFYASTPTVTISGDGNGATAVAALPLKANAIAQCSGGALACYPPVVNYSPLYYQINGVSFDKTNASRSLFATSPSAGIAPGMHILVRLVNAGSRMHVPSIVGAATGAANTGGMSLIAEDGNVLPGVPRVQSEVFMAAGKTYDVMVNAPAAGSYALPVYDRELSLSGNSIQRDTGMLAYIGFIGADIPPDPALTAAKANPDEFDAVVKGQTLTVSDPGKGVIANDLNVYAVKLLADALTHHGTLTLNPDGTFSYVADNTWTSSTTDTYTYCGNGATTGNACTVVALKAEALENASAITCPATINLTATLAKSFNLSNPGVLAACTDAGGFPLTVTAATNVSTNLNLTLDNHGGFTAYVPQSGGYSFMVSPKNSQGVLGASITVNLTFPAGSGLAVTVLDGSDKTTAIADYRWIIEEDRTFFVDPNCTANPPPAGCPGSASGVVPNFGTNFHTSFMPVVAAGCTGDISCENNQTIGGQPGPQTPWTTPADVALCSSVPAGTACLDPTKRYYISVLPGDAAQPFIAGYAGAPDCSAAGVAAGSCGHGMGGAPIAKVPAARQQPAHHRAD